MKIVYVDSFLDFEGVSGVVDVKQLLSDSVDSILRDASREGVELDWSSLRFETVEERNDSLSPVSDVARVGRAVVSGVRTVEKRDEVTVTREAIQKLLGEIKDRRNMG